MDELVSRLGMTWMDAATLVVAGVLVYAAVIAASRLVGLRSFAKMSAFDFAMTVAIGSIIAGTATGATPLAAGTTAVAVLFAAQYVVARLRRTTAAARVVDNSPLLLMYRGRLLDDHLARARLSREDLRATLRAANVLRPEQVAAVVFETTGDISVLTGDGPVDPWLLEGVRCGPVDPSAATG